MTKLVPKIKAEYTKSAYRNIPTIYGDKEEPQRCAVHNERKSLKLDATEAGTRSSSSQLPDWGGF